MPSSISESTTHYLTSSETQSEPSSSSDLNSDSDFHPDLELKKDPEAMIEEFAEDWVASLPREDQYAFSIVLFHILQQDFQLLIYPASKIIAKYIGKNYKTIQKWRTDFIDEDGEIPEFARGRYNRMNAISKDEKLSRQARSFVRENAFRKGAPNMTCRSFCSWVNDDLLPNSTLQPGAPRKISVEVARKWLLDMGFKSESQKESMWMVMSVRMLLSIVVIS